MISSSVTINNSCSYNNCPVYCNLSKNTSDKVENEKNYAVNKVTHRGKKTANDSVSTSRKMIRMYKRHKRNEQRKIDKQNVFEEKAALEKSQSFIEKKPNY